MKKSFKILSIVAFLMISTAVTMAAGGGKKKKSTSPPKGTVILNYNDSTATRRVSDSTLEIPAGFKLVEKPR